MAHFVVQCFRQPFHRMLGCRIQPHIRGRKETEHGTDVDDASRALRAHVRQDCPRRAQDAEQVGVEQGAGFLYRGFFDRPDQHHTGIVDEYVNTAGARDDGLHGMVDRCVVAHVHLDQFDAGHGRRLGEAADGAEYFATTQGKLLRGRTADTGRDASYHYD